MEKVREGSRRLINWVVEEDTETGEFVVEHYIGGEDAWLYDGHYSPREVAEARVEELNKLAEVHVYYRDWEGDPEDEYLLSKTLTEWSFPPEHWGTMK